MRAVYAIPVVTLALAIALVAKAEPATAPGAAPGEPAKWEPSEHDATIVSPRDPASGQAVGAQPVSSQLINEIAFPKVQANPQASTVIQDGNLSDAKIVSPRDPASGQATGKTPQGMVFTNDTIDKVEATAPQQGAGNASSFQAPSYEIDDISQIRHRDQPQAGSAARTETVNANEAVNSPGGMQAQSSIILTNATVCDVVCSSGQQKGDAGTYREGGVNDTTLRTKIPRRNRNGTRGKRMHKP